MIKLSEELRYKILKKLEQNPTMTQRELAKELGLSLGKANYCLKALVQKGLIKVGNFRRSKYKLGYAYLLTPKGLEEKARVTMAFLDIKQKEYDQLQKELKRLLDEAAELSLNGPLGESE